MNKKAFSLVELIVGIVISMILMAGVGVMVSGGIGNIVMQDKIIQNTGDFREFSKDSLGLFSRIDTRLEPKLNVSGTSAIVRIYKNYDKLGISYIGEVIKDGIYCNGTDVDSTITTHILIKNFLPFEEIGEDIFSDYSKNSTGIDNTSSFKSFYKSHIITDNSLNILVGKKGIFGKKIGANGLDTYLNNPTGLAYNSIKKLLYIADTGNNRVLAYNNDSTSADYKKIVKLLGEKDGLNEPMGLALYDNKLFIVNSGNGEILEYSSKVYSNNPNLILTGITEGSVINKFEVEFLSGTITLTNPDSIDDFTFTPDKKNIDDYIKINDIDKNKIKYYFISSLQSESNQSDCTAGNQGKYVLNASDIPIKCSGIEIGTGKLANLNNVSFNAQKIKISDIKPNFSDKKNYYIKLNLYDDNTSKYEKYFPYFVQGDDDLTTRENNTLKIISSDFKYPTGIEYDLINNKLKINNFWDRKEYSINLDGTGKAQTKALTNFDYSQISEDKNFDYFLNIPIDDLDINYDVAKKYLNLKLVYFKQYNCYNLDEKIKRTLILTKSYK